MYLTKNEYKEKVNALIKELKKYESKMDVIENKIESITDELNFLYENAIIVNDR